MPRAPGSAPTKDWPTTTASNWAVYRPALDTGKPEMYVRDAAGTITPVAVETAPAHNYVLAIDFQGDDIWVATAKGLSHGIRQK